jgi:pyruvate kinase
MNLKKTKIVCTIGPASWDPQVMKAMIDAGMNCARINGAFADEAELDKVTKLVRDISDEVSLMVDVKGPEVRMNKFAAAIPLKPGDELVIGNDSSSDIYPANYADLYKHLKVGQRILIGDGDVELKVTSIEGDKMNVVVVFGEALKPGKAMNLPGADIASQILTEKDKTNLKHAMNLGWDFVSASFIQNAEAAREVNDFLKGSNMKLIAKIEDQAGVDNIDEILEEVDGIMVARGGLGVELGLEFVPIAQRILIEKALYAGKMVITATQMLESMIANPRPTRAEANDVATAIFLGTDSVMLSGESSAGQYPVEAVKFMSRVAEVSEPLLNPTQYNEAMDVPVEIQDLANTVIEATMTEENLEAIVVHDTDGDLARLIARNMPYEPVVALVESKEAVRFLSLAKGVVAFTSEEEISALGFKKILKVNRADSSVEVSE